MLTRRTFAKTGIAAVPALLGAGGPGRATGDAARLQQALGDVPGLQSPAI